VVGSRGGVKFRTRLLVLVLLLLLQLRLLLVLLYVLCCRPRLEVRSCDVDCRGGCRGSRRSCLWFELRGSCRQFGGC